MTAMARERASTVNQIKQLVEEDAYRVDPRAVADAILRRLAAALPPAHPSPHGHRSK
jgi:anti-sigma28 factor (negative regulator of flagellin synthesis)